MNGKLSLQSNAFKAYMLLNEAKKKEMRLAFHKQWGYAIENNSNTFYRKLHNPEQLWDHEKEWIAKYLKTSVKKLFGKEVKNATAKY